MTDAGSHLLDGSPSTQHIDVAALDGHRFADGGGYPPSYRAFVQRCGWARSFGLWLIYPPVLEGYADGRGRARQLTERFRATYAEGRAEAYDWMVEPDGRWELVDDLEVLGWSENGDFLLWDVARRDADGELPVWESRGGDSLHLLGAGLDAALPLLRERAVSLGFSGGVEALAPTRV